MSKSMLEALPILSPSAIEKNETTGAIVAPDKLFSGRSKKIYECYEDPIVAEKMTQVMARIQNALGYEYNCHLDGVRFQDILNSERESAIKLVSSGNLKSPESFCRKNKAKGQVQDVYRMMVLKDGKFNDDELEQLLTTIPNCINSVEGVKIKIKEADPNWVGGFYSTLNLTYVLEVLMEKGLSVFVPFEVKTNSQMCEEVGQKEHPIYETKRSYMKDFSQMFQISDVGDCFKKLNNNILNNQNWTPTQIANYMNSDIQLEDWQLDFLSSYRTCLQLDHKYIYTKICLIQQI